MKAILFRNWCVENISPQSWSRIVLKSVPALRDLGVDWESLDNPTDDLVLKEPELKILQDQLDAIYQLKIEEGMLS